MQVIASFYIGEQLYLNEEVLESGEDKSEYTSKIEGIFDAATKLIEEDTYESLDADSLHAILVCNDKEYKAQKFVKNTATDDDSESLPILLYIEAYFEVEDSVNIDNLDWASAAMLQIGDEKFTYAEIS